MFGLVNRVLGVSGLVGSFEGNPESQAEKASTTPGAQSLLTGWVLLSSPIPIPPPPTSGDVEGPKTMLT